MAQNHASQTERIEHNLTLHPPLTPAVAAVMDDLRAEFKALSHKVDELVPDCREKSQALTDLEDGCQHAIGGVARNQHLIIGDTETT